MHRALANRTRTESLSSPTEQRNRSLYARCSMPDPPTLQETVAHGTSSRIGGADSVLWMRDVTALTGVHRSTITRWINRGEFPKKDAPHGNPNGWLRSTYDRWLLGAAPVSGREVDFV
jgi:predicted DNA-binding transcriptional regulator AlpA